MNTQERIAYWLNHPDLDPALREELLNLTDSQKEDAFYKDVKFETAGMRGLMGVGTNRLNIHTVRKATQGLANWLKKNGKEVPTCVIAYDNRYNSKEFAYDSARMLASSGVKTYVFDSLRPTPELSFAVRYLKCDAGIMITASHNPKEYNGYKVYDENGCQLIPPLAQQVIDEIDLLPDMLALKPVVDMDSALITIVNTEVDEAYYKEVLGITMREDLNKDFRIAYSPEHGASYVPVKTCLTRAGYDVHDVESQKDPNPAFANTKSPNPEVEAAYEGVLALAKEIDAELLLVCDPDGDRMGVGVKHNGEYILLNGNQTGAVLMEYILMTLKEQGKMPAHPTVYNTIVTSDIGKAVAESYGAECIQTLTGFKYIGDQVKRAEISGDHDYVFGYEESYGSLVKPFVRDKDATQACLMLAEACAYYRSQGKTLYDVVFDIFERCGAYADKQVNISLPGADGARKLQQLMGGLRETELKEIGGVAVTRKEDYKLRKAYDAEGEHDLLGHDISDVLKYFLADGSYVCVRPSGTEPKCKIYLSTKADTYDEALAKIETYREAISVYLQ
ncbi:MAG: phospho-sugar mutase [Erysipelotrichaceae bacterium]|nr:phospho-sugar mutase [Erysipelotrichaceae bacterium]MBQ1512021.1 phospho-sugar mutase [Erysipelotrichaceae bacterium]MBQ1810321.1 phospho-sugar mutase [Erysipelotrichaceae bacterium]MBR3151384.1 phospho-sugar mutase [Erysipelotrichaceae bacterium]MBR3167810.1 phospho-sugar mutase [Erysipelotrichaceae bacterium]